MRIAPVLLSTLLLITLGKQTLFAAEDVIVRLSAKPDTAWIGEKVVLLFDVLGKDSWAQLKKAHDSELEGGYLKRFESQGTRLQETIEGASYTGQRYEYLFFPQRPGVLTIDPVTIDVELKRWGTEAESEMIRMATPPVMLNVRTPPGVQIDEVLISTSSFTATQSWDPDQTEFSVGDAVTRTVKLTATDVSGMVFPPIEHQDIAGVGLYPASPEVEDKYDRGDLRGQRIEKITYVMEQGGAQQASDLMFSWWNTEAEELETVTLNGKSFSVKAAPGSTSIKTPGLPVENSYARFLWMIGVVALFAGLGFVVRKPLSRWFLKWREQRNESERSYFKRVTQAAARKEGAKLLNSAIRWLDRISTDQSLSRLDLFLSRYGSPQALEAYGEFCSSVDTTGDNGNVRKFYQELVAARSKWLAEKHTIQKIDRLLPPVDIS